MTRTFAILSVLALATPAYADFSITPNEMDATVSTDAGPALPNPQVAAPRPKHHHATPLTSRSRHPLPRPLVTFRALASKSPSPSLFVKWSPTATRSSWNRPPTPMLPLTGAAASPGRRPSPTQSSRSGSPSPYKTRRLRSIQRTAKLFGSSRQSQPSFSGDLPEKTNVRYPNSSRRLA